MHKGYKILLQATGVPLMQPLSHFPASLFMVLCIGRIMNTYENYENNPLSNE